MPGIQSVQIPGQIGHAARTVARGMEALGSLMTSWVPELTP